jgi:hypothetical protein
VLDNDPEFLTSDIVGCCVVFETIFEGPEALAQVLDELYLLPEKNSFPWKFLLLIVRLPYSSEQMPQSAILIL